MGVTSGLLCCGTDPLEEEKAAHIVDDIGQSDPHGGSGDADGSDEQPCL